MDGPYRKGERVDSGRFGQRVTGHLEYEDLIYYTIYSHLTRLYILLAMPFVF